MTAAALLRVGRAMDQPVHGSQQAFRTLLDAFAAPGRVLTLPAPATDGIEPPADRHGEPLPVALPALLLTLLDRQASVRLHGALDSGALGQYLRFHTGVRAAPLPEFEVLAAEDLHPFALDTMALGSDEQPQQGATAIVAVRSLDHGCTLTLQGPGIAHTAQLRIDGVAPGAWAWRQRHQADYPRGVDLVFVCGARLAALPRSTRILEIG